MYLALAIIPVPPYDVWESWQLYISHLVFLINRNHANVSFSKVMSCKFKEYNPALPACPLLCLVITADYNTCSKKQNEIAGGKFFRLSSESGW